MTYEENSQLPEFAAEYTDLVIDRINKFLVSEISYWDEINSSIIPPLNALKDFINAGGKRLRPAFCLLGYKVAGGKTVDTEILAAGSALELLHNFALIHDDIMDRADTRRGKATVHKALEDYYKSNKYEGDIEHLAQSVAILTGDFAYTYADSFARAMPQQCLAVYDQLKVELFAGQQMDLDASYRNSIDKNTIASIAQYKSGKYSIERPLQIGALAHNENPDNKLWEAFGKPLGLAFQLRDDILGIFGDAELTGKPVGDDIREGKYTLLIAEAYENTSDANRVMLDRSGNEALSQDEVEQIIQLVDSSGAREKVEKEIGSLYEDALIAIESFDLNNDVKEYAVLLANYVCWRQS